MTVEKVIRDSTFLLETQKEKLIDAIQDTDSLREEGDYMKFLDKVFKNLLNIRVDDLSANEKQQIKYALHDLGVVTSD